MPWPSRGACLLLSAFLFLPPVGCARRPRRAVRLASTTSTDNTGLLEYLLPAFERECGPRVEVIATGTGRAIKHGEEGDVDVLLVHARAAEEKFVADGHGIDRRAVMHNDFVLLGPEADGAEVARAKDAAAAFERIARASSRFVSRGDDSGTHRKEKELWGAAGVEPGGPWYMAAGQGMASCINIANETEAYILADRGTYLALMDKVDLVVVFEGDAALHNPYGVIAVDPAKHPHVNYEGAAELVEWITSPRAQRMIAAFTKNGQQLFHPDAVPPGEGGP